MKRFKYSLSLGERSNNMLQNLVRYKRVGNPMIVIRKAMVLYTWLMEYHQQGYLITFVFQKNGNPPVALDGKDFL